MEKSVLILDKVLLSPYEKEPRGVEIFNLNLIKRLAELGLKPAVLAHRSWRDVVNKWTGGKAELIFPPGFNGAVIGGIIAAFNLRKRKFGVLLLANVANRLTPAIRLLKFFDVSRRCALIAHREPSAKNLKVQKLWPTTVVAVNGKIGAHFINAGFKSVIIKYGITDGERFYPAERKEKKDTFDFCVLGHLNSAWKGADTAVAAFRALPEEILRRSRLHLASYHNPPSFSEKNIIAHSWMPLESVPDFLRKMDAMLVPSRDEEVMRETFSQAMVQGMLTGLPVVANDLPVLKEKLDKGGGMVFRNTAECAAMMERLACNPALCDEMGAQARKTALERYLWDSEWFVKEVLLPD